MEDVARFAGTNRRTRRTNVSNAKKDSSCGRARDVLENRASRVAYSDIANEMYPSMSETADGDDDAATVEARSRYLRDCVELDALRRRATDEEIVSRRRIYTGTRRSPT